MSIRKITQIVSALAWIGTLLPACLLMIQCIDLQTTQAWMLASSIIWFVATPLWMERKQPAQGVHRCNSANKTGHNRSNSC